MLIHDSDTNSAFGAVWIIGIVFTAISTVFCFVEPSHLPAENVSLVKEYVEQHSDRYIISDDYDVDDLDMDLKALRSEAIRLYSVKEPVSVSDFIIPMVLFGIVLLSVCYYILLWFLDEMAPPIKEYFTKIADAKAYAIRRKADADFEILNPKHDPRS